MNMIDDASSSFPSRNPHQSASVGGRSSKSFSVSDSSCKASELSVSQFGESLVSFFADGKGVSDVLLPPSERKKAMRIRVINEQSQRSKDLVVEISSSRNLYDAVYDNQVVKDAHVRKWGPTVVQQVKSKTSEIHCAVWDDVVGNPCHVFSIDELKQTSTQQLYELVPEIDLIKLVLQCLDKEQIQRRQRSSFTEEMKSSEELPMISDPVHRQSASRPSSQNADAQDPAAAKVSRCPFSGAVVDPNLLEQFKEHIAAHQHNDHDSSSSESMEDPLPVIGVSQGGSGPAESRRPGDGVTHSGTNQRDQGAEGSEYCPDSFTATIRSDSTIGEDSFLQDDRDTLDIPSHIGLRVTNQISLRSKDLLVPISEEHNLYDSVYNNQALKDAHVRKWGSQVVRDVKADMAEINMAIWDETNGKPLHVFAVEELKTTSTLKLHNMIAGSFKNVHFMLQCVSKPVAAATPEEDLSAQAKSSDESWTSSASGRPSTGHERERFKHRDYTSDLVTSRRKEDSALPVDLLSGSMRTVSFSADPPGSVGDTLLSLELDFDPSTGEATPIIPTEQKNSLRIRISNRASNRCKDLVVDISDNLNLYDAVYNNRWVKEAHVRKWGPQVVEEVKNKTSEIQIVVWDDDSARPWKTLTIDELRTTTTRDLYEAVPESSDLVKLFLECVKVSQPEPQAPVFPSLRLENGKPQSTAMMRYSKSESCLKRSTLAKKTTRLNHMTVSSMTTASNGSNERLSSMDSSVASSHGRRQLSHDFWNTLAAASDHKISAGRARPRRKARRVDIDAFLMKSQKLAAGRSLSSDDLATNFNAKWEDTMTSSKRAKAADSTLSSKVQRFIQLSESKFKERGSDKSLGEANDVPPEDRMKEFMRLCNAKKSASYQSKEMLDGRFQSPTHGTGNAKFPPFVQTTSVRENPLLSRVSSITLQDQRSNLLSTMRGAPNATFISGPRAKEAELSTLDISKAAIAKSNELGTPSAHAKNSKVSDRISRFLRFSQPNLHAAGAEFSKNMANETGILHSSVSSCGLKSGLHASLDSLNEDSRYASPVVQKTMLKLTETTADIPPIAEIEVFKGEGGRPIPASATGGISLSPELVKEVFPYHVVLDSGFRILQVGNNFANFIDEDSLIGRVVSDILMVTSPIPMFGKWDWNILDKMRDKTVFLESVITASANTKVKIKGTIIEISSSPRMVMLALFPNVKNLSELESMDLSMADLPLHSCQREAVLLGEHSKSEVKLTNHLDQLHRDLINSMEKQIEDRTNELASANQDLERANAQLAMQSARQLEHFACMSHEIRTPLNCIVGMSSLLLDDADDMDPMHADSIRMINTSGDLLKAVVDDVLDYAKLESGSFEVDIKPTNLQDTLASVVHSISQKVQEKNIRLRTHFSATLPLVLETDSRRLQQVLFNLLGNAGKFSKNDSVIDLSVDLMTGPLKQEEGQPVKYSPSGKIIRFSVKDYGKGIDKKDFKTIFEPFSQASKETQNLYGGTGLGLSITSKLVHRLGGTVGLDSEPGKFTEFTVDLPFIGIPVDVVGVRRKLEPTTIVLVETPKTFDYSFSDYPIRAEPAPFNGEVVRIFGLDVSRCSSMDEAYELVRSRNGLDGKSHFAFLVHESLYDFEATSKLDATIGRSGYTLMTFGPNYAIQETKAYHFKSLLGFFPAALLEAIAENIVTQDLDHVPGNDEFDSPELETVLENTDSSLHSELQADKSEEMEQHTGSNRGLFAPLLSETMGAVSPPSKEAIKGYNDSAQPKNSCQDKCDELKDEKSEPSTQVTSAQSGLFSSLAVEKEGSGAPGKAGAAPGGLFAALLNQGDSLVDKNSTVQGDSNELLTNTRTQATPSREPPSTRGLFASLSGTNILEDKPAAPRPADISPKPGDGLFAPLKKADGSVVVPALARFTLEPGGTRSKSPIPTPPKEKLRPLGRQASKMKLAPTKRDLKVLYAEDNLVNQKVLSRVLSRAGIDDITIVDNGQKAVDICATSTFDCIFMDMQMPIMDGMEATKIIVERDPTAFVLFVSAHALDEYKTQAEAVGAKGFFSKPFRTSDIEAVLDGLSKRNRRSALGAAPGKVVESNTQSRDESGTTSEGKKTSLEPQNESSTKPKDATPTVSQQQQQSKAVAVARNLKVLYAEDNQVNQKVLARVLNRAGVTDITIVDNGQQAVDVCLTQTFDVIFMDMEMPVLSGMEACTQIVAHNPQACVVFVTAHTLEEFKAAADAAGATSYITKPFRLNDVESLLDRLNLVGSSCGTKDDASGSASAPVVEEPTPAPTVLASEAEVPSHTTAAKGKGSVAKRNLKVLYAEDNVVNQKVLSRVLNRAGIEDITIVDNGKSAVDMYGSEHYDVVFMDMQMPIMDGMEACKQIVKHDPSAMVIFVTAHALDEFKNQAVSIGAKGFISKPFRLGDIQRILDELNLH